MKEGATKNMERYEPLISILIPCYNNQKFLYELLQSIFDQTYQRLEILIGNDGSTSFSSHELIGWLAWHRPEWFGRISIYDSTVNRGTVANIEHLQAESRGDYLFHIAADDVLYDAHVMEHFVDKLNHLVENGDEPEILMAQLEMWDHSLQHKIEDFIPPKLIRLLNNGSARDLFAENSLHAFLPPQFLYNRSLLKKIGPLRQYRFVEDWPAALRYTRMGIKPYFLNGVVAARHRDGGISHGALAVSSDFFLNYHKDLVNTYHLEVKPYENLLTPKERHIAQETARRRTDEFAMRSMEDALDSLSADTVPANYHPMGFSKNLTINLGKSVLKKLAKAKEIFRFLSLSLITFLAASLIGLGHLPYSHLLQILLVLIALVLLTCSCMGVAVRGLLVLRKKRG